MNKHYFTGYITNRQPKKVYTKSSPFYQQLNYKLTVKSGAESHQLLVYTNLITPAICQTITTGNYLEKRYLFTVKKSKWSWILLDWQEIPSLT